MYYLIPLKVETKRDTGYDSLVKLTLQRKKIILGQSSISRCAELRIVLAETNALIDNCDVSVDFKIPQHYCKKKKRKEKENHRWLVDWEISTLRSIVQSTQYKSSPSCAFRAVEITFLKTLSSRGRGREIEQRSGIFHKRQNFIKVDGHYFTDVQAKVSAKV